jgi:hypothetical protein
VWLVRLSERPLLPARSSSLHDELDDVRDRPARTAYRWAIMQGWGDDLAGRWAAWCVGIQLTETGWTLRAVDRALFLRYLVATGRIGGPTDAPRPTAISPSARGSSPVPGPRV